MNKMLAQSQANKWANRMSKGNPRNKFYSARSKWYAQFCHPTPGQRRNFIVA